MATEVKQQVRSNPGSGVAVQVCAAVSGGLALLALLSWTCNAWELGTFGRGYIPMAPSTACLFLLLGLGISLRFRRPEKPIIHRLAYFAVLITVLASLLTLAHQAFGFELFVERWWTPAPATVGNIPVGRMSPLTALAFLLNALAFLLTLPPFDRRRTYRQTSSLMATATLLISLAVLMGYAVGAPLLYSSRVVPMALLTAFSFALLSFGILIAIGPSTVPLSLFRSPSGTPAYPAPGRFLRGPIVIFLLLIATIGTSGAFYLRTRLLQS